MINWFTKRNREELPDYWRTYEALFKEKPPQTLKETRFVVLDTETTGFDFKEDRVLCIGAVSLINNTIDLSESFELYIKQDRFNPQTVAIHGIIKNEKVNMLDEDEALKRFLKYIENSVLVAHHAGFDIGMLNQILKRMALPKLKNKVLDTMILYRATRITSNLIDQEKNYSLDEIAENYNIELQDRHTAAGDAYITAMAFIRIVAKLNKNGKLTPKDLFRIK
ncbi:DNA polymerase-3 subunit epsilon [Zhouia amylolytica]|uniref:DNA polymerase-3 subunit epsilon n=1 Tax=Zhouia amylolytica TaxID=376730 RepID=A0A1I6TFW2_9FLAO|nr:3'-5' exonuclease [Zhouia amylolytica]MCQ0112156.1 3'-5' exonuclease [Zhouia amylolytica]SFS88112.1 DNA polymerase-3 subunit epsilon [Zhouia amylolytica]